MPTNGHHNSPAVSLPGRRRLRTFAFDPMSTRLSGRFLVVDVPFEAGLEPGPTGELVHVVDYDATREHWYHPVDLDDAAILAQDGLRPSEGDPRSHQQVVYAVSMSVLERFERFAGRRFRWRAERALRLVPHAFEGRNAYFDPRRNAVLFGYYRAERDEPGANLPGQVMFTCLSSDIIAHEVTHAIVHRWRRYYSESTNPDVFAWHEAFADLVALFQHFVHRDVVVKAVSGTQARLHEGGGLLDLAQEFGQSTGRGAALRSALGSERSPAAYLRAGGPHERGACFVAGVFDAYLEIYQSRIADLLRIATGGTGVLPPGNLHPDLVDRVASEAAKAADLLLGMVVRAFDYLPVVDVTFGDVVRAIVSADRALYPDDDGLVRSRLVEALRQRGIFPSRVASLTDEALAWPRPEGLRLDGVDLAPVTLSATRDLDPTGAAGTLDGPDDQAGDAVRTDLGSSLHGQFSRWASDHAYELGLDPHYPIALQGVHVAYRQAADDQPRPEVVVQLSQRRPDLEDPALPEDKRPIARAGTTLLAGIDGRVDALVVKPLPLSDPAALDRQPLPPVVASAARAHHEHGGERLEALRAYLGVVEQRDALSPWTLEPAQRRLTFASLHAHAVEG